MDDRTPTKAKVVGAVGRTRRSRPDTSIKPVSTTKLEHHCSVSDIRMKLWRHEDSGLVDIELTFPTIGGGKRERLQIGRDQRRQPKLVLAELDRRGAELPADWSLAQLSNLLLSEGIQLHRQVATPGWHLDTFVPAKRMLSVNNGSGGSQYVRVARGGEDAYIGHVAGTSAKWRQSVGSYATQSTAMSFSILVALAAPLASRMGLPEGALFNFFGQSWSCP